METQNPYSELYKIIKTESSAIQDSYYIGTIDNVSPLKVGFAGIQVDNCLVNADIRDLEAGQRTGSSQNLGLLRAANRTVFIPYLFPRIWKRDL